MLNLDGNAAPSIRNITAREFLAVNVKVDARIAVILADPDKVEPSGTA